MNKTTPEPERRFSFGANWADFLSKVSDERVAAAEHSLMEGFGAETLLERSFLDAGCRSGLFSLAAHRLGATVVSFDFDPESVMCAETLKSSNEVESEAWTVVQGSLLDEDFLASLGTFDLVYCWGVAHHTGSMWEALDNLSRSVEPDGFLFLSIYNDQGHISRLWLQVKRLYNESGWLTRKVLVSGVGLSFASRRLLGRLLHPRRSSVATTQRRGMDRKNDLIDWVGGFPFEVAKPEEIFYFYRQRGFDLLRLKTCGGGLGCNEFVFRKSTASSVSPS